MNPILIALIAVGALALVMATKKKALAAGTGVNRGSPYDNVGGTSYDPNALEGPPAPAPPAPKKKGKGFRGPMRVYVNPIREKLKGLTAKEGAAHSALHFGLHSRPLPGLPAEGDSDAWFAIYNSDSADELSEAVRIAMRAVTRELQTRFENNQYMRGLGVYVPAWTPELSHAGGIGAAGQAALIQLATQKMRAVAQTSPALFAAVQQILAAPPGWSDKEFRESWAAATTNPDGTSPERDALYASTPTLSRNPGKQKVMDEWRARTEIRALETPMMTIIADALVAAVPNHTYDTPARQGEVDAVANALWEQMRGAHARGETQVLFSEMFQRERELVRGKVKTLWNEAATAVGSPALLPIGGDASQRLEGRGDHRRQQPAPWRFRVARLCPSLRAASGRAGGRAAT